MCWTFLMGPDAAAHISLQRGSRHRTLTLKTVCILAAGALGGCSMGDGVGSLLIDPGHYSVYHCKDLVARLQGLLGREKELSNLMDKASEGGGGQVIGNLSYRLDYENTVGEEKLLRRTAAEKKCELPPPAGAVAPTPSYATSPQASAPGNSPPPGAGTVPVFQSDQGIR